MTRCECTGLAFADVERSLRKGGLSLEEVAERTGCGRLCTACLPDLRQYLRARALR
jgi:bacterioferritin-associated ferredoxin